MHKEKGIYQEMSSVMKLLPFKIDELVKSQNLGDKVKSSSCKARESLGMRCAYRCVGMIKDEAQRSRWTFYEVVKIDLIKRVKVVSFSNAALLLGQQTSLLHTTSCSYQ